MGGGTWRAENGQGDRELHSAKVHLGRSLAVEGDLLQSGSI